VGPGGGVADLKRKGFASARNRTPIPQQCRLWPSLYFSAQINSFEWGGGIIYKLRKVLKSAMEDAVAPGRGC
jgi:hypothetical protein